jgi:hypothetical protein
VPPLGGWQLSHSSIAQQWSPLVNIVDSAQTNNIKNDRRVSTPCQLPAAPFRKCNIILKMPSAADCCLNAHDVSQTRAADFQDIICQVGGLRLRGSCSSRAPAHYNCTGAPTTAALQKQSVQSTKSHNSCRYSRHGNRGSTLDHLYLGPHSRTVCRSAS